jgi:hypothetical protein
MNHQFYPVLCADADYVLTSLPMFRSAIAIASAILDSSTEGGSNGQSQQSPQEAMASSPTALRRGW